jgi:hypothetical protein
MQKILPTLLFLLCSLAGQATDTLFVEKNLPEKFKVEKNQLFFDSANGHVYNLAITKNRVMLHRLNQQMMAEAKSSWGIGSSEEEPAPAINGYLKLDETAGELIKNQDPVLRQVRGDSLFEYYVEGTSAEIWEIFYDVKNAGAGYRKMIQLVKGEFPYAINLNGNRIYYVTSYKKSSDMRVQIFENGLPQKEQKFTVNLQPGYDEGWMSKDDDETLSKLLPNMMMGDVKAMSLFLVKDAGSYQPFDATQGFGFVTKIQDTLKLYAPTKKGVLFCFSVFPETGQWSLKRVLAEQHFAQLQQKLTTLKWPETITNLGTYEAAFSVKTIAETQQFLVIARVQKPQLHLIFIDKTTDAIAKAEYFDADGDVFPETSRIYSALDFAKRPASSAISNKKFTTVAVASLGLAGINAIELPNKKLLLALMVKDERITVGDVLGAVAGSVLLEALPGASSLAGAFAQGAAAGFAGSLVEGGLMALNDNKVYMYAQVYDNATLQPVNDTLPLVPELEQSFAEIQRVNDLLREDMKNPSYLRHHNTAWISWYNKSDNAIHVMRKTMQQDMLAAIK